MSVFDFHRHYPFLVAVGYAIVVSAFVLIFFPVPPPRFMDMYLIGIVYFLVRWSRGPALFLYFVSMLFSTWVLPPKGSFAVTEGYDVYRMVSYSATVLAITWGIEHVKSRRDG